MGEAINRRREAGRGSPGEPHALFIGGVGKPVLPRKCLDTSDLQQRRRQDPVKAVNRLIFLFPIRQPKRL
jgi:hypothetical protein